ncbi:MAG: alpha-ketoglutarate-dependent dioxygenase AlkB [Deltaproteobacteria bacterium]|nr:alpha-ketoglutarate-dependent dioxygenase AlkB [Deltaproteobacteria bacterium]
MTSFEAIPLPDAEISYLAQLPLADTPEAIMQGLITGTAWRAEKIVVWGKTYAQPRLTAWYGNEGIAYTYSGIRLEAQPWTETLRDIKQRVEKLAGVTFNSVLLNYYRNERDSMGLHSDDEPELGRRPTIASLSLGAERMFLLKHKSRKDLKPVRLKLASGSLLLMKGETQHCWKHGIEKMTQPCLPRVNLTFRRVGG